MPHAPSPPPSRPPCQTRCSTYFSGTPMASETNQTELSIFLKAHNVNVYIPPASSCNGCYSPPLDLMLTGTESLVLGEFNAHHSLWHFETTDSRDNQLADSISISSFAVLNTDSHTRLPGNADPISPDVSLASASLSHHLVQMANTHNHDLRPSASD